MGERKISEALKLIKLTGGIVFDVGNKLSEPGATLLPPLTRIPGPGAGSDTQKIERQQIDQPDQIKIGAEVTLFTSQQSN